MFSTNINNFHIFDGIGFKKLKLINLTYQLPIFQKAHCQNSSCRAYNGGYVLVKWGYRNGGVFDFFRNERDCECPICGQYVQPENFGFNNTDYKVVGYKRDRLNGPYKDINTDWKYAPSSHYTTFKDGEEDMVYWGKLEIRVRRP